MRGAPARSGRAVGVDGGVVLDDARRAGRRRRVHREGLEDGEDRVRPRARAAIKDPTDPKAPRLELMLGLTDAELDDHASAAAHLAIAYKALPELADYIGYHLARSLWLAHDPAALDIAQSVAKDSIVGADAEILVGDLMRGKGDWRRRRHVLPDYLSHHPNGPFRSEARFDLAEAIVQREGRCRRSDHAVSPDHDRRSAVVVDDEGRGRARRR